MDALRTLAALSARLRDAPRALDKAGGMAVSFIQSHLHDGKGWSPLAPATAAFRGQGRPLQDTGALMASITYMVKDDAVVVGTNKKYAAMQNNGGVIRAKKEWLWMPGPGMRKKMRKYGYRIRDVLDGLRSDGYAVFRKGRAVVYYKKGSRNNEAKAAFYLKKSVAIPARPFFFITGAELNQISREVAHDVF